MGDFEAHFSKGQEIEVGNEGKGFEGSWYAANIVQIPRKKMKNKKKVLLVEYKTLMDNVETSKPLRNYVDTHIVRPQPPKEEEERFFFELGETVEVYHNHGWWEGIIHQVVEKNLRYLVYFRGSGEELEFKQSDMRSHRPWINGKWVRAQKLQTIDSSVCIGASVEVCFKDENYRDAWFPATLLKRINYSSFLVEYQSLRLQFMVGKSKETVDSPHIRPLPPDTSQGKRFDLLEKVDAFTDCGWWSGVITKILAGSKYIVFFKYRHEQKEFSHSELRFHMDWIDGKWFQNSKEISPQGQIEAPGQVKSGEAVKTDRNIEMASRCGEDAVKNVAIEKLSGQVQSGDAGKTGQNVDMGSQCGEGAAKNVAVENSPGQVQFGDAGKTDQNIDMASQCGDDAAKDVAVEKSPGQVKSGDAGKTDHNIDMASRSGEDAAKNVAVEKSPGQVQYGEAGMTFQSIDMASQCGEDAAKNVGIEKSPEQAHQHAGNQSSPSKLGSHGHRKSHQGESNDQIIDMAVAPSGNSAKTVVAKKSPSFRNSDKVNSASYTINSCKTPTKMQSTSKGDTDSIITREKRKSMQSTPENITKSIITREKRKKMQSTPEAVKTPLAPIACRGGAMASSVLTETDGQCGEDTAKNVAVEKSPGQARQQAGNQSSPSKLGSPGYRQTHQADPFIDMAVTPCGNAAKTVVSKKSLSFIISRKVDNQSTPDKVSSASYTLNSCKKRKIQSTSESDTDCLSFIKNKKIQSTSASDTDIIISNKKTKEIQSTPESDTNVIMSSKKTKKVQSTLESNTDSSRTCKKLKTSEVLKTPLSQIAFHARAMATRLQTEADRQYDFATQATEGQGANVEDRNSSENVEGKRVECPILAEMFLNCSEEGYKDHTKHLNSGQELLKHVFEGNGSRNQSSVEGSSHLPPNIIDVEQSEVVDLPKTQVSVRPTKLMIRQPLGRKGEPLARDDINQPTTKKMSKQNLNVYHRKTRAEDFSTKASVKDVEHSGTIGRLQAPVLTSSEAQIKGPEQTTPSDTKDLHPPSSAMCLRNSNVAQIIDENGMSYDNQPAALSVNAITRKDSPLGGSQLRNSLNVDVSSFCFEGAATNTLLDQAIGDEVSEHTQQSFLICSNSDPMLIEDENFPFIKCSAAWEIVESWEVFRVMPQRLHFRPLEQFHMVLREGLALGSMVSFANIVEKVRKSKLDDPPSILQDRSKALEDLKAYGFNIQPIQGRLETILRIKDEHAKLNGDLMKVEDQFNMKLAEKISREKELDELDRKMRELQECLNQLSKKKRELMTVLEKEVKDSSMAELKKTMDNFRGYMHRVTSEFRTVVATPW